MALTDIYALQTQYQNSEDEYNELMQNTNWLVPGSQENGRAKHLNEEMPMILRSLIVLLNKYKQPNSSDHYNKLLTKYESLQRTHIQPNYTQQIKDNEVLITMNEFYVVLWICVGLILIF